MSYAHADAVKLAGHSCPMVTGAYLMVQSGLTQTILFRRERVKRKTIDMRRMDVAKQPLKMLALMSLSLR